NSYGTIGSKTNTVIIGNGTEENQTITCSVLVQEKKSTIDNGGSTGGSSGGSISPRSCSIVGNINGDTKCSVDIFDFNLLMLNWGSTVIGNTADLNKDDIVDILDFNILILNWTGTL
ncbi:MAG: hypothetical protein PHN69_02175, partial [Candidatus Pacebacteria bacterium]|nr:hypothetical protein [Candidatus Paceibacterota bacterium]